MLDIKNIIAAFLLGAALVSTQALAVTVDPRDYTALPAGANLNVLYTQFTRADDLNIGGDTVPLDLRADIGIYRFVHFTKFMGMTIDPQFLIPFGELKVGDNSSSGLADALFATTFWLYENPEKKSYFGITPFVRAPTGTYDSDKPVNLGDNRWSYVLGAGYMTQLTKNLGLDLIADVEWFGDNDDPFGGDTLEQDNAYQVQAMLSYDFSPVTAAHVRYSWTGGAEKTLDGVSQNDETDTSTVTLGVTHWLIPGKVQAIVQYVTDTDVNDFGFETETIQFRLLFLSGL